MMEIISNIPLKIPEEYHFSFTNSPYYAHWNLAAVDIYPPGREIISPFSGRLIFYRNFHGEHICGFEAEGKIIRILHLKPSMLIGDEFDQGDFLGYLKESPTFRAWTDYHIHLELRENKNFLRAGGVKKLKISREILSRMELTHSDLEGRIRSIRDGRYILLDVGGGGLTPIVVGTGKKYGYLEGGLPHYGHGGVIGKFDGDSIMLDGKIIGKKMEKWENYLHIRPTGVFHLGDMEIIGISLYLNFPYLKVIPKRWDLEIFAGQKVKLEFR